jgi:glycosyltransferase involved in cell wall biosynthesis
MKPPTTDQQRSRNEAVMKPPTISAVVTVYNAEQSIGDSLRAILSQTHPPDEVVVVDDGSTDGTPAELARFREEIRVLRQDNRGHAPALNVGMRAARGDYLAKCDADDIWEPHKLAQQVQALQAHPEIDIAFSAIQVFGESEEARGLETVGDPSVGILDQRQFARTLYRDNVICPSSTLIRRRLYEQLGPFAEHLAGEDYDYWMRALRVGAVFYYDPARLLRYRRHSQQLTSDVLRTRRAMHEVHALHEDLIGDRSFVHAVHRDELFRIGRQLVEEDRPHEARQAFLGSLRHGRGGLASANVRALVWVAILTLPPSAREHAARAMVEVSRAIDDLRGGRHPVLP